MEDRIREAMLVLEHHRALFRLKHARTEGERYKYKKEVQIAENNLKEYEREVNDRRVQTDEKANNTRETSTNLRILWKKDNKRK